MRSEKGNKWMNLVEDMCAYKENPIPEMKHGGNHHEWAKYELSSVKNGDELGPLDEGYTHPDDLTQDQVEDYHNYIAEFLDIPIDEVRDSSKYNTMNPLSDYYVHPENRPPDNMYSVYKDMGWNIASIFPDVFGEDEQFDLKKLISDDNKIEYLKKWKENQNNPLFPLSETYDVNPVPGNIYSTNERDFIINDLNSKSYRIRLRRELALSNNIEESAVTDEMLDEVIGGRMNNILGVQEFSGYPEEYTDTGLPSKWPQYSKNMFDWGIGGMKTQGQNLPYSRIYYGEDYSGGDMYSDQWGGTPYHELNHATATGHWYVHPTEDRWVQTPGGLTSYTSNLLTQSKIPHKLKNQIPFEAYEYESDDDEVYTRYKKAQRLLKEKGIFDYTTGEKMTDKEYQKLQKYLDSDEFKELDDWNDIKEFFGTDTFFKYGQKWNEKLEEKEIRDMFDNVAMEDDGSSLTMAQTGEEIDQEEEIEFVQDEYGNIDTEGIDYTREQIFPFLQDKYTKVDTSDIQQNLLDKLNSQTFRDRYRKNIFNMTGENLSEEELTNRINEQYEFSAAGAPFHIVFPYVSHSPRGYRRSTTPYIHPYFSDKKVNFAANTYGLYTENPYWYDDSYWNNKGKGYWSMDKDDINLPEMMQYSYVPHLFNKRDPYIMGDNQVEPQRGWYNTAVHEYAHSYNTERSPLFKPAGDLFATHPAAITGNTDDGYYDVPGERYKTWLTGLFGEDYWDPSKNQFGKWAMKPWEISSIKAENEDKLRRFGVWDNTQEPFSADKHLNLMLKADKTSNLSESAEGYHLKLMGYSDLERLNYNIGQVREKQDDIIEDWDWNIEAGRKGTSGDFISNRILDFNSKLTNLQNDPDAREYEINRLEKNQVMDQNTFNDLFNSSQSELDEKHRYDDYNALIEHLNLKDNVFNRKKIERANKVLNSLYDKVREQLEVNPELDDLKNQFDKKKKEVGPKLEKYFNEIAQNEEIGDDIGNPMQAKFGTEMDTDEVADKYNLETEGVDEVAVVSSGDEEVVDPVATKHGGELSVWNKDRYSTSAKKYRRGGESLPKYQDKGEVKELTDLEKTRKSFSQTGEFYGGVLSGHEIQDIFDFNTGRYKDEFIISYNNDGTVNLDPEVLKWRSVKGFSTQDLLMWWYHTQREIPFYENQENRVNVEDGSTWKNKNYGYINGEINHPYQGLRWYPKDKSMAHAMSRDMKNALGLQIFFYEGYPFTNEEGDEADIRLGLKPGKQMQELNAKLKTAKSKSEVTEIMREFYQSIAPDQNGMLSQDQIKAGAIESITYINNVRNPFGFSDGALLKIADFRNRYLEALEKGYVFDEISNSKISITDGLDWAEPGDGFKLAADNSIQNTFVNELLTYLFNNHKDELDDGEADSQEVIKYIERVLDGNLNHFFDDHAMELINHEDLPEFRSKSEFLDWTKSTEFKQGLWNPNMISYLKPNGEVVKGDELDLPYKDMYDTYYFHDFSEDKSGVWPIDPFDGQPQYRIYTMEDALTTNRFPATGWTKGNTMLGEGLSYLSNLVGGDDIYLAPVVGHTGTSQALVNLPIPKYNPFDEWFEYYDYDDNGMVSKVHKFRNPTYDTHESKEWRRIYGSDGTGKGGTITTNQHGNDFLNFLMLDQGKFSTENLDQGSGITDNPYFMVPEYMGNNEKQLLQPHKFLYMDEDQINNQYLNISAKNVNPYHTWNGANWIGGGILGKQLLTSGAFKAATWKSAGKTLKNYWTNPGKWGWLGSGFNSLNYGLRGGMNVYDKTSVGRIGGWTVPGTGVLNMNNLVIGNWAYDHLTDSYNEFKEGDILGGTYDLGFGLLNSHILYGRLRNAYGASSVFNYGKFPDFNKTNTFTGKFGTYDLGLKGSQINQRFNPTTNTIDMNRLGPLSTSIRHEIPAWSLRNQANTLFNRNIFSPQLTQSHFNLSLEEKLLRNQMNQYGDFGNIVPKFNLTKTKLEIPKYNLGDFNKNKIIIE